MYETVVGMTWLTRATLRTGTGEQRCGFSMNDGADLMKIIEKSSVDGKGVDKRERGQ